MGTLHSGSVAQPISLAGLHSPMSAPMRQQILPSAGLRSRMSTMSGYSSQLLSKMSAIGMPPNPFMNLAVAAIEATNRCGRDISESTVQGSVGKHGRCNQEES